MYVCLHMSVSFCGAYLCLHISLYVCMSLCLSVCMSLCMFFSLSMHETGASCAHMGRPLRTYSKREPRGHPKKIGQMQTIGEVPIPSADNRIKNSSVIINSV